MAYYQKVYGATKEEAEKKAYDEIKKMDVMRQPSFYSIQWCEPVDEHEQGKWVATVKYWGID